MKFSIELLPESYAICRLDPTAAIPTWTRGGLVSITRTPDELSIVCQQTDIPDGVQAEREWCCFRIAGKLDFSLVGVIATLTQVLAATGISVFVMSTYDTDYFLVRQLDLLRAVETLEEAGHSVQSP